MEPMSLIQIANIANLSYENETTFKNEISKYKNCIPPNNISFFNAYETYDVDSQIYSIEYPNKIIFSIRGTSSKSDILSDLYVFKKKFSDVINPQNKKIYKNIKVHSGFLQQYNSVKFFTITNILKQISNNKSQEKINVIFTSHSLGAAVSVLLSTLLKTHFGDKLYITNYLFGCPKIGNNDFIRYYNDIIDETYRYVYKNDIVPRIPKINYKTTKNRILLGNPNNSNCFNQIFGNINDHSMLKYVNKLKKLEPQTKSDRIIQTNLDEIKENNDEHIKIQHIQLREIQDKNNEKVGSINIEIKE